MTGLIGNDDMKCPHCQKEISEADSLYCPYCGKKLKPTEKKKLNPTNLILLGIIWTLGSGVFSAIFFAIDDSDTTYGRPYGDGWHPVLRGQEYLYCSHITWAPTASIVTSIIILNIISAYIVYHHAKRHGRNPVAWATAFAVFSPLLAGIAYGLTWPKSN